jgi:hypothetical protein
VKCIDEECMRADSADEGTCTDCKLMRLDAEITEYEEWFARERVLWMSGTMFIAVLALLFGGPR